MLVIFCDAYFSQSFIEPLDVFTQIGTSTCDYLRLVLNPNQSCMHLRPLFFPDWMFRAKFWSQSVDSWGPRLGLTVLFSKKYQEIIVLISLSTWRSWSAEEYVAAIPNRDSQSHHSLQGMASLLSSSALTERADPQAWARRDRQVAFGYPDVF